MCMEDSNRMGVAIRDNAILWLQNSQRFNYISDFTIGVQLDAVTWQTCMTRKSRKGNPIDSS